MSTVLTNLNSCVDISFVILGGMMVSFYVVKSNLFFWPRKSVLVTGGIDVGCIFFGSISYCYILGDDIFGSVVDCRYFFVSRSIDDIVGVFFNLESR